jgi:hypothetical protein
MDAETLYKEVSDFWGRFNKERQALDIKIIKWVYDRIQENFKKFNLKQININVNIDYDDCDNTKMISISMNGYLAESELDFEDLDNKKEMERLMASVVIDRLDDIDHETILYPESSLDTFLMAMGYDDLS